MSGISSGQICVSWNDSPDQCNEELYVLARISDGRNVLIIPSRVISGTATWTDWGEGIYVGDESRAARYT